MRRLSTVAATIAAVVTTSVSPSLASAAHRNAEQHRSAHHPYLVWSRFDDFQGSTARLVLSRGGHVVALTHPPAGVQDIDPRISPDGRRVLFERDYPDRSTAWIVSVRGGAERQLDLNCVSPCAGTNTPSWTRDGRHILYDRVSGPFNANGDAASADLWKFDLRTHRNSRFSYAGLDPTTEETYPTFAPAGYLIVLHGRNDGHSAIFRERADGTHPRQLTPWSLDADLPRVSPARRGPSHNRIVFETYGHGAPPGVGHGQQVATISATCRSVAHCVQTIRYLTRSKLPAEDFNPSWSPNGRRIAYVHFVAASPTVKGDIWSMRSNGSRKQPVSQDERFEFRPAWGRVR
jgi:Tol biopolymer transport system component